MSLDVRAEDLTPAALAEYAAIPIAGCGHRVSAVPGRRGLGWCSRLPVAQDRDPERQRAGLPLLPEDGLQPGRHRPVRTAYAADRARIGGKRTAVRSVVPACHTRQEHQLPLSTCQVRSGPWTTWSVTGPDRTVAPRLWRPGSRAEG